MVNVGIAYNSCIGSLDKDFSPLYLSNYKGEMNLKAIEDCKLIIFTGGEDINPSIYNQKNLYSHYNPNRDNIELTILKIALELNKKLLGICRGHQLINTYLGGFLVQDIRTQLNQKHYGNHKLDVLIPDTIVTSSFKNVNSLHHQGVPVGGIGKGLWATTFYNGVYESTENDDIITVQFHPEFMYDSGEFFNKIKSWAGL